jgi:hypothetical protein
VEPDTAALWVEHLRGGRASSGGMQALAKPLSTQLLRLPEADWAARDGLLALLAPLLPPAQLWSLCVRWRDCHAAATDGGVDAGYHLGRLAAAGEPAETSPQIARWLEGSLDQSLAWLQDDLALLGTFVAGGVAGQPMILLDQICLRRAFDAFNAVLARLRALGSR